MDYDQRHQRAVQTIYAKGPIHVNDIPEHIDVIDEVIVLGFATTDNGILTATIRGVTVMDRPDVADAIKTVRVKLNTALGALCDDGNLGGNEDHVLQRIAVMIVGIAGLTQIPTATLVKRISDYVKGFGHPDDLRPILPRAK